MYAEVLSFKAGDKASYTISQKLIADREFFGLLTIYTQSEATIDVDIEILSSSQETSSYPFDVEVTLRKILISELNKSHLGSSIMIGSSSFGYDSSRINFSTSENHILAQKLNKLIDHPLNFRWKRTFKLEKQQFF